MKYRQYYVFVNIQEKYFPPYPLVRASITWTFQHNQEKCIDKIHGHATLLHFL